MVESPPSPSADFDGSRSLDLREAAWLLETAFSSTSTCWASVPCFSALLSAICGKGCVAEEAGSFGCASPWSGRDCESCP